MKTFSIAAIAALGLGTGMHAASAADFDDYARVVSVTPRVERVSEPYRECRTEYVPVEQRSRGAGGSILGGIAGGLIGNQVGGGNGRTVATAAGAIAGAIVGDRMQNRDAAMAVEQRPVQSCRVVERMVSRNDGYLVTYEYRGHAYTDVMDYDPGDRIPVRVEVTPRT